MKKLEINGRVVDLDDTPVATTYQIADVGDLQTRHCNRTNRFKAMDTPENAVTFGFADSEYSGSDKPYVKLPAKLFEYGLEVLRGATAQIESSGSGGYNIEMYQGAREFFTSLGDKTIEEIVPLFSTNDDYSGNPLTAFVRAYIDNQGAGNEAAIPLPDTREYMISYLKIIEAIISSNGYEKSGTVFSDARLAALNLFPLGDKGNYTATIRDRLSFDAFVTPGTVMNLTTTYQNIPFNDIIKNASGYFNGSFYTSPDGGGMNVYWYKYAVVAQLNVISETGIGGGATALEFRVLKGGVASGSLVSALGFAPQSYWFPALSAGNLWDGGKNETIQLQVRVNSGFCTIALDSTSRMYSTIDPVPINSVYKNFSGLVPFGIKQADMMRDFAMRFGVLFNESGNTLICKTYKEILTDKANAKDWTTKRDTTAKDQKRFEFNGKYAQNNYFKYQVQDQATNDLTGIGNLAVPNEHLESKKDLYTSVFSSSVTRQFGNSTAGYLTCASILWSAGEDPGVRLLMVRAKRSIEPTIAGGVSSYNVAYFVDAQSDFDCSWEQFIDYSYDEFRAALQKAKLFDRRYNLSVVDINSLDLFRLIYDSGLYYMVVKVNNFVSGKPTAVQIFKVN